MTTSTLTKKKGTRGGDRRSKTLEQHRIDGTFRPGVHAHLVKNKTKILQKPPQKIGLTKSSASRWIRSEADAKAVNNGCRFDEKLANHAVDFFRKFLKHSKGQWAGQPFELLDWQRDDVIMPIFGWIRPDGTRRIRRTYIEVAKKNGKSTLASAIGIYMLTGDGEPGAEVYSIAADRDQASIVHNEAINMVESSPDLLSVLKVNKSTRNIKNETNHGFYRAVSSEPGGKEGINIHCGIYDEVHVWKGRKVWDALKYGYRSRRQPLQFVITTAGDDSESVCWEQHEYAREVISGDIEDDSFLGAIYAAEPTDDWTDPKVWKKANPSLGHTMNVDDFERDCKEAQRSRTSETSFKRYSLNVWATVHNPFLDMGQWEDCARELSIERYKGQRCWLGLDLSKVVDMTALVAMFKEGDDYTVFPYFWVPEAAVNTQRLNISYANWVASGHLVATPGDVVDYSFPKAFITQLCKDHKVQALVYDPWNAEQITQELEDECRIERVAFQQTIKNFANPTADFERLVIAGRMHHPNHPILNWQAGNVTTYTDCNNNRRPVKPKSNDHRKIDGVVAAIMALGVAALDHTKPSVYETKGRVAI